MDASYIPRPSIMIPEGFNYKPRNGNTRIITTSILKNELRNTLSWFVPSHSVEDQGRWERVPPDTINRIITDIAFLLSPNPPMVSSDKVTNYFNNCTNNEQLWHIPSQPTEENRALKMGEAIDKTIERVGELESQAKERGGDIDDLETCIRTIIQEIAPDCKAQIQHLLKYPLKERTQCNNNETGLEASFEERYSERVRQNILSYIIKKYPSDRIIYDNVRSILYDVLPVYIDLSSALTGDDLHKYKIPYNVALRTLNGNIKNIETSLKTRHNSDAVTMVSSIQDNFPTSDSWMNKELPRSNIPSTIDTAPVLDEISHMTMETVDSRKRVDCISSILNEYHNKEIGREVLLSHLSSYVSIKNVDALLSVEENEFRQEINSILKVNIKDTYEQLVKKLDSVLLIEDPNR